MNSRVIRVLVGVWLATRVAAADASRVSLRWAAPDECPDDVQLVHQVEALLGQSLPEAGEQTLTVHVNVQGNPSAGYAAKLSFASPRGTEERYLEHPSCDNLVQAVALVVALTIDPERVHARQLAQEERVPEATPESLASPKLEPAPTPLPVIVVASPRPIVEEKLPRRAQAKRDRPLHGARLALHGVAGAGPLPNFGVGLEAALGWHRQSFRAELLGRYWVPRQATVDFEPSARVALGLETLGARACWLPLAGAWQLAACAGADLGDAHGEGVGVQNPQTAHARYSQAVADFQVAYTRSQLAPEGGLELSGAFERPAFGVRENGQGHPVFQPAAWGFSVFLGLAFEL